LLRKRFDKVNIYTSPSRFCYPKPKVGLPKEFVYTLHSRMLIECEDDEDRIAACAPLLGKLLSYGEPLSMDQFGMLYLIAIVMVFHMHKLHCIVVC